MKKSASSPSKRLIAAFNARAQTYRVLSYLMHTYGPCRATKIVSDAVQQCHEEAIRINESGM